jgi:hypothetical protein
VLPSLEIARENAACVERGASMTLPKTMKATVLIAPDRVELQDRPVPEPGPEDCLVRVRACGV